MNSFQEHIAPDKAVLTGQKCIIDVSARAVVSLRGRDGLDLIQRISTNDVSKLETGNSAQTILTNEKGKIIDVISLLKLHDDDLLIAGNSEGDILRGWLEKYIIMEDAAVSDRSSDYAHFLLYGSTTNFNGKEILEECYKYVEIWNGHELHHVICPAALKSDLLTELKNHGYISQSEDHFTSYRVEHGIPAYPNELSVLYNPMETGLIDLISFTKGCYIGQEVIARLDTYKKVQKRLVKLRLGAQPPEMPIPIFSTDGEVGNLTSYGSDSHGQSRALGYVKTTIEENSPALYCLIDKQQTSIKIIS